MAKSTKKVNNTLPKADRATNRGWADGWRDTGFLRPYVSRYADAMQRGLQQELALLDGIYRQYAVKVHWTIPDSEEPPFPVNEWREDVEMPVEDLTDEEMIKKREVVEARKKAIRRWLRYRARKINPIRARAGVNKEDPYGVLLAKLCGVTRPPKARQAFQEWQVANGDLVHDAVERSWAKDSESGKVTGKLGAGYRQTVARTMFLALPAGEREKWAKQAKANAEVAKAEYKAAMEAPPSDNPSARAECIAGLPSFFQPIAEMVAAFTGLQLVVHAAGPMPQYGGKVHATTICSGRNLEDSPATIAEWKPKPFSAWTRHLKKYAKTCYTPAQLRAARSAALSGNCASPGDLHYDLSALGGRDYDSDDAEGEESDEEDTEDEDDEDEGADDDENVQSSAKKRGRDEKKRTGPRKKRVVEGSKFAPEKAAGAGSSRTTPMGVVPASSGQLAVGNGAAQMQAATRSPSPPQPSPNATFPDSPSPSPEPEPVQYGPREPTYEEQREANIATIKLHPLFQDARDAVDDLLGGQRVKKVRAPRKKPSIGAQPQRRSGRLSGAKMGTGNEAEAGDDSESEEDSGLGIAKVGDDDEEGRIETEESGGDSECRGGETDERGGQRDDGGDERLDSRMDVEDDRGPVAQSPVLPVPSELEDLLLEDRALEVDEALTDAPSWFTDSYAHFDEGREFLGSHWTKLVDHFVLLEAADEYASHSSLPRDGRPEMASKWVNDGRLSRTKTKKMPTLALADLPAFKRSFQTWYDGMQPSWRSKVEDRWVRAKVGRKKLDWELLDVRGVNGMLTVIATLYWWGMAVRNHSQDEYDEWEAAVDDVSWVLQKMGH